MYQLFLGTRYRTNRFKQRRFYNRDFQQINWSVSIRVDLILSAVQEVTRSMYKRCVPACIGLRLRYKSVGK